MAFTPRTTAPTAVDPHWLHISKGGKNECILIGGGSCLPNCVGYAWGRAYEILGSKPRLSKANAENWYLYTQDGYKRSKVPSVGAIICWAKGVAGDPSDGAGHVAVVEEVKANGDVVTSNSAYNGTRFYMQTVTKASGYKCGNAYTFQGFIDILGTSKDENIKFEPYLVKVTATALNVREGAGTGYSITGCIKDQGTYTIVEEVFNGTTKWGKLKSGLGWISLGYTKRV